MLDITVIFADIDARNHPIEVCGERYILREAALTPFDVSMAPEILM